MVTSGYMKSLKNLLICLSFVLVGMPTVSIGAEMQTLEIEFSFTAPNDPAKQLLGYRLYKDGEQVCDSYDHYTNKITCDIFTEDGIFNFTLVAYFYDGTESLPSPSFAFAIGSIDEPDPVFSEPDPVFDESDPVSDESDSVSDESDSVFDESDSVLAYEIQELYFGYLGRTADLEGLIYWVNEIKACRLTMEQLRANLTNNQPEYTNIYGGLTRRQLASQIYRNLFERNPDVDGLEYWVNGGGSIVSAERLIVAFLNAAAITDQLVLDSKITEAMYYIETN